MEACVRGFAYMPQNKLEVTDLQYIEGRELEQTWKTVRRQRLKEQEQKIWDEFVKEQDVVKTVFNEDPYQFLDQLPENCLKELMETELEKMKKEREVEEKVVLKQAQQEGSGDSRSELASAPHHVSVTFAEQPPDQPDLIEHKGNEEDLEIDSDNIFHIFEDDRDDEPDNSGTETGLNDSLSQSPCTVRENNDDSPKLATTASKSSENVSHMIESSIYCAKVKDIRIKINEEMLAIISSLERQDLSQLEMEDVVRAKRRSAEFCNRFNRIYLYQLQRQVHDLKRNCKVSLPFAKHTQFQSQMVRIVSLHQNMLQALQVFHSWFSSGGWSAECMTAVRGAVRAAREHAAVCAGVPAPQDMPAPTTLYQDVVLETCDKLDVAIDEYTTRANEYFNNMEKALIKSSKTTIKSKGKKRPIGTWSRSNSKSIPESEARLSMYSLERLRLNLHSKPASSRNNIPSGLSKMPISANNGSAVGVDKTDPPRSRRNSPRSRRNSPRRRGCPLMRAPGSAGVGAGAGAGGRSTRVRQEQDVRTMVESVPLCASTLISRDCSPLVRSSRRDHLPATARAGDNTPRKPPNRCPVPKGQTPSPLLKVLAPLPLLQPCTQSPKLKQRKSPKPIRPQQSSVHSDYQDSVATSVAQLTPVSKILCAKKEGNNDVGDVGGVGNVGDVGSAGETSARSPRSKDQEKRSDGEKNKVSNTAPGSCEVTRLLRQLCGGDACGSRKEHISGAKNAQLFCVKGGGSPRQPSTPQLLRILEETIQKKVPKQLFQQQNSSAKDANRLRLMFNISEKTAANLFQYRTKFVQHMLTSPMYANSVVGKPWEMIGSISEQIIDELLLGCAREMELQDVIKELYKSETH